MRFDISYILSFPAAERSAILASLGALCVNTPEGAYDPTRVSADSTVHLLIDAEDLSDPGAWGGEGSIRPDGRVPVGSVQLWIRGAGERLILEFWPTSSTVGQICLGSPSLRRALVGFLERHGGSSLRLDRSDGSFETLAER